MQKSKPIYLIGYSGHGRVLMDAAIAQGFIVKGYFQDSESDQDPFLLPFMGNESDFNDNFFSKRSFILGIGDNKLRNFYRPFYHFIPYGPNGRFVHILISSFLIY